MNSQASVNATAAGAATAGGPMDPFTRIRLSDEAMEDRSALLQIQVGSVADVEPRPCVDGRCACPRSKGAPIKDPPTRAEEDEFVGETKEPWKASTRRTTEATAETVV